jgi:hypothetical protein
MFLKDIHGREFIDADLVGRIRKFDDVNHHSSDNFIVDAFTIEEPTKAMRLLYHVSEHEADDLIQRIGLYKDRHDGNKFRNSPVVLNP